MKLRNKKTGEVKDCVLMPNDINDDEVICNSSLAELNEEWEDYKPVEPLIKDEKIRKAVRAWAEAFGVTNVYAYAIGGGDYTELYAHDNGVVDGIIRIPIPMQAAIELGDDYTVDELCGEE